MKTQQPAFEDRDGAAADHLRRAPGWITGDLTPECAAMIGAVLDALSAPATSGGDRTREQRDHDALAGGHAPAGRGQ